MGWERSTHVNNVYRILVGKSERNRPLEICRCKWDDNIEVDLSKHVAIIWTRVSWLRIRTGGGLCEHGNET
jgi:hypothetical protein